MPIDQLIEGNLAFQSSSFKLFEEEFNVLVEKEQQQTEKVSILYQLENLLTYPEVKKGSKRKDWKYTDGTTR
jgi:hypothetical protein